MIIKDFKPFVGQHCETTTVGGLLYQLGIELSEPMLFGIGEGLSYIIWSMKIMDFPFIGGRVKPDVLTQNICRNLNLRLDVKESSSLKKSWANVEQALSAGQAVGLKLDCYHLEYFNTKIHFAGHYAGMYGYDDTHAYLIDTDQQGGQVKASLENLTKARSEKGPMSSRNKSFTISQTEKLPDLNVVVRKAIQNNATEYLNPPIKNLSYKGIKKTATVIKKWFETSQDIEGEFQMAATLMERAGTGGALFRNFYRDFLKEAASMLQDENLEEGHLAFKEIVSLWTEVSDLFHKIGETQHEQYLAQASEVLIELSEREKSAMELLLNG